MTISTAPILEDPHDHRARELESIGLHRLADQIRRCGTDNQSSRMTCKRRICPDCVRVRFEQDAQVMAKDIREMERPGLYLVTLNSEGIDDLGKTMSQLRALLLGLRRPSGRLAKIAATGAIQPKLALSNVRWSPHVHLVLDTVDLDVEEANRHWQRLTGYSGWIKAKEQVAIDHRDAYQVAAYACAIEDWSPTPGSMSPPLLAELIAGTKSKRHLIRWKGKNDGE